MYWQMFYVSVPLKISPETTLITGPLNSQGRIDYEEYLNASNPPETKTEKNGFRLLVEKGNFQQVTGCSDKDQNFLSGSTEEYKKRLADRLGLDPRKIHTVGGITGLSLKEYLSTDYSALPIEFKAPQDSKSLSNHSFLINTIKEWGDDALYPLQSGVKWSKELTQLIGDWTEKNAPFFDLLSKALQQDNFIQPIILLSENNFNTLNLFPYEVLDMIACRCNYRIRTGNIDGALDDLAAISRWQSFIDRQNYQRQYIWYQFAKVLMRLNIAANPDFQPTKKQWERYAREVLLPVLYDADQSRRIQTLCQLNRIQNAADGFVNLPKWRIDRFWSLGFDWNIVAKQILSEKQLNDENIQLYVSYYRRKGGISQCFPFLTDQLERQLFSRRTRSLCLGEFLRIRFFNIDKQKAKNTNNLRKVLYAMEKYRLDHGSYPPALTRDEKGRILQSWRVLLLPYLGQKDLFDKIRLREPWNSEYNRQFHSMNIEVYRRADNEEKENSLNAPDIPLLKGGKRYCPLLLERKHFLTNRERAKSRRSLLNRSRLYRRQLFRCW